MDHRIEKILVALNDKSEVNKSYRSYVRYIHQILENFLMIETSVLIFRVRNYFIKSEFINKTWFLSIDNITDDKHYNALRNISVKEILEINPQLRLFTKSFQQENDFNILFVCEQEVDNIEQISHFIFFMLDTLFTKFIQTQKSKEIVCIYKMKTLANVPEITVEQYLQKVVGVIASTWTFNKYSQARIKYQELEVRTKSFKESILSMKTDLFIDGKKKGYLEITYPQEILQQAEYPFLQVEKLMIIDIAKELANVLRDKFSSATTPYLKQLRHTDRLATLGQLVSGATIQLNEPLNDILGFAELLTTNDSLDKDAKSDLNKIINASLSVRDIVKKLMHFSGQVATNLETVDINESVKSSLALVKARSNRDDIEVKLYLSPNLPTILIDSSQFHQIIVNILINAEQAIKNKDGIIQITSETSDNNVILTIADNGEGIPDKVKHKIFVPLYSTKHENVGTGIGLSVAKDLIEANGGSISFQSTPNIGTVFTLTFPIHRGE